uniref:Uncharacterized protein n=1 Tax=Ciona savignyi TaxID=51511 RepID=H2Z6S9_CIOSA
MSGYRRRGRGRNNYDNGPSRYSQHDDRA